jgi:hypothetical protein
MSKNIQIRKWIINLSEIDKTKHKIKKIANELDNSDLLSFNSRELKELNSYTLSLVLTQLTIKRINKNIFLERILDTANKIKNEIIAIEEERNEE